MEQLPNCLFSLMQCPRCRVDYALCPDPANRRQVLVFPANRPAWPPLATVAGHFSCYQCHESLALIEEAVALSAERHWIVLHTAHARVAQQN